MRSYIYEAMLATAQAEGMISVKELIASYRRKGMSLRDVAKIYGCSHQAINLVVTAEDAAFPRCTAREFALANAKDLGFKTLKEYFASRPDRIFSDLSLELGISETTVKRMYNDIIIRHIVEEEMADYKE